MKRTLVLVALALAAAPPALAADRERKYSLIRSDEDWSWLDTTPPAARDPFDGVKNARLSDAWTFLLGGATRLRVESDTGRSLGASPAESDTLERFRTTLHWQVEHREDFRWFVELRWADTMDADRAVSPLMRDDPDVQGFFLEGTLASATSHPVTLRAGRQELLFGAQRLVSPLDWSNTRRAWDGLSVVARTKTTRTTAFATRPVVHEIHSFDSPSDELSFSGVTFQSKPREGHVVEAYGWLLHDASGKYVSSTGRKGDVDRFTWGAWWSWSSGGWSGDAEAAAQTGSAADDDVRALMLSASAGFQWKQAPCKPRASVGLDHASGDGSPLDRTVGTFEAPFPLGHAYLGHVDLVGRKNVQAARAQVELWPAKGVKLEAALHRFRLAEAEDALYDAANAPLRRDATGASGTDVGTELDVLATWTFRVHHQVGIEIARFWSGSFLDRSGAGNDVTWGWVGYEFKF